MSRIIPEFNSRAVARALLWLLLIVVVLFGIACMVIPRLIERRWQRVEALLTTEKITTDFWALQKPPLPAEGNFFSHPDLRDLPLDGSATAIHQRREDLKALHLGLERITLGNGAVTGKRFDLSLLAKELVSSKVLAALPAPGSEAKAIRDALETRPLLLKLAAQAAVSSHAEFIPALPQRPRSELIIAMMHPHLEAINKTARPLALHGIMCAEMGDLDAALLDLRALSLMALASQREGTFISELVGNAFWTQTMPLIWTLLEKRQATASQLRQIEHWLSEVDHEQSFLHAARGEFAMGMQAMDYTIRQRGRHRLSPRSTSTTDGAFAVMPDFLLQLNRVVYAELMLEGFLLPLQQGGFEKALQQAPALNSRLKPSGSKLLHFDKIYAFLAFPVTDVLTRMCLYAEVQRRQALAACALERYYLEHQRYPTTLAELSQPPPTDPLSQRPLSYQLIPRGRYQIWSWGIDGKDDSGHVQLSPKAAFSRLTKYDYLGDWTWRYEPMK